VPFFIPVCSYTDISCSFVAVLFLYWCFLFFSTAIFPESQARAEAAVAKVRVADPASDAAPWAMEECITALSARVTHMSKLAKLPDVAIKVFKCLWPGETVPDRVDAICTRLEDCGARLHDWRRSAARSGVDTALQLVCSWYEDLDLDALETL
jgi:hypothetical protein